MWRRLPRVDFLQRTWTPQREFELFRDGLSRLEPDCQVVTLVEVADAGFVPFEYLAPGKVVDTAAFLAQPPHDGCVTYYRSGNCFALDLMPREEWGPAKTNAACRAIEQSFGLEPIVERTESAVEIAREQEDAGGQGRETCAATRRAQCTLHGGARFLAWRMVHPRQRLVPQPAHVGSVHFPIIVSKDYHRDFCEERPGVDS